MIEVQELEKQIVEHLSYGKGIICSIDEKYLQVYFSEKDKTCKFAYPSCFMDFLTLQNEKLQTKIQAVLETWKEENNIVQKEELRHQYEKTMEGIEARRRAGEEKKLKAAQRAMEHRFAYSSIKQEK